MNEITQSSRVTTALRVIERMNEGLNVKDACQEVGMPRSTFYDVLARDPEAIAIFQDMVIANSRERLWIALDSQTKILQKIIADGLAETTKPRDRLAIFKTLGEISEELSENMQRCIQDDKVETFVMPTVVFRPGKSRIANTQTFNSDDYPVEEKGMSSRESNDFFGHSCTESSELRVWGDSKSPSHTHYALYVISFHTPPRHSSTLDTHIRGVTI